MGRSSAPPLPLLLLLAWLVAAGGRNLQQDSEPPEPTADASLGTASIDPGAIADLAATSDLAATTDLATTDADPAEDLIIDPTVDPTEEGLVGPTSLPTAWTCGCTATGCSWLTTLTPPGAKVTPLCYPPTGTSTKTCANTCPVGGQGVQCLCPSSPPANPPQCPESKLLKQVAAVDGQDPTGVSGSSMCNIASENIDRFLTSYDPNIWDYCLPNLLKGCREAGTLGNRFCGSCLLYRRALANGVTRSQVADAVGDRPGCDANVQGKIISKACQGSIQYPKYDPFAAAFKTLPGNWYVSYTQTPGVVNTATPATATILQLPAKTQLLPNTVDKVVTYDNRANSDFNVRWLMVPTNEVRGMEEACNADKFAGFASYFQEAFELAVNKALPPGKLGLGKLTLGRIAVMPNIPNERSQHQLHIHVGRLSSIPLLGTSWKDLANDAAEVAATAAKAAGVSSKWAKLAGTVNGVAGKNKHTVVVPAQTFQGGGKFDPIDCNNAASKCEVWVRQVDSLRDAMMHYVTFAPDAPTKAPGGTCDLRSDTPNSGPQFNRFSRTLMVTADRDFAKDGSAIPGSYLLWVLIKTDTTPGNDRTNLNDHIILCDAEIKANGCSS